MLHKLDGKTSESDLCIEEYLIKSERAWFKRMREAKLGRSKDPSPAPSLYTSERGPSTPGSRPSTSHTGVSVFGGLSTPESRPGTSHTSVSEYSHNYNEVDDEFLLGHDFKREWFLKRWMLTRVADWPIYSLLLALGQIIAANSYQITLLTGGQGEVNEKLYIVGGIYVMTSCLWWLLFRSLKSVYVLSLPFLFYGLAFLFVGMSPFVSAGAGQDWLRNVATGMYVTASSSGSLFFALNFGDEGKSFSTIYNPTITYFSHRRCPSQILDLSCRHHPRDATNLRHCPFLLGKYHRRLKEHNLNIN
jgi:alpha-1,3-glucan synthase